MNLESILKDPANAGKSDAEIASLLNAKTVERETERPLNWEEIAKALNVEVAAKKVETLTPWEAAGNAGEVDEGQIKLARIRIESEDLRRKLAERYNAVVALIDSGEVKNWVDAEGIGGRMMLDEYPGIPFDGTGDTIQAAPNAARSTVVIYGLVSELFGSK